MFFQWPTSQRLRRPCATASEFGEESNRAAAARTGLQVVHLAELPAHGAQLQEPGRGHVGRVQQHQRVPRVREAKGLPEHGGLDAVAGLC